MAFFRSYIAPLLIVLTFLFAMVAVSARIFLPSDMMAPAPIEAPTSQAPSPPAAPAATSTDAPAADVSWLIKGLPNNLS